MMALTGPSGSGKSTLLHLIGAIERADSGQIITNGVDVHALKRARLASYRRGLGFVFQRYHLLPTLTALENVICPCCPTGPRSTKQLAPANYSLPSDSTDANERCHPKCLADSSSGWRSPGL